MTGLSDFGMRYYSATLGRWLNRDPIGNLGGANVYAYVGNNPTNRTDYLGLMYIPCPPGEVCGSSPGADDPPQEKEEDDKKPCPKGPEWGEKKQDEPKPTRVPPQPRPPRHPPTPYPPPREIRWIRIGPNCYVGVDAYDRVQFFNCHGYAFGRRDWVQERPYGAGRGFYGFPDPPLNGPHWYEVQCPPNPMCAEPEPSTCDPGYDYVVQVDTADGGGHSVVHMCADAGCGYYQKCGADRVYGPFHDVESALRACGYTPNPNNPNPTRCLCIARS